VTSRCGWSLLGPHAAGATDFEHDLATLADFKAVFDVRGYCSCLIFKYVHLILGPGEAAAGLAQLMKGLAGRQAHHVKRRAGRHGLSRESSYKSSPTQTDAHLNPCWRYAELNLALGGIRTDREGDRWANCRKRIGQAPAFPRLYPGSGVTGPGTTRPGALSVMPSSCAQRPARQSDLYTHIRKALQRGQLTDNARLVGEVKRILGRPH